MVCDITDYHYSTELREKGKEKRMIISNITYHKMYRGRGYKDMY
jgi:hypothetical protein